MRKNITDTLLILLLVVALPGLAIAQSCKHESAALPLNNGDAVFFRDVQVFTGRDTVLRTHQDVLVQRGRIVSVVPTQTISPPEGVRVITAPSPEATLMPGFVDAHVHLTASGAVPWSKVKADMRQNAATMLEAGVTTVYDLGGQGKKLEAVAEKVEAGKWDGPRIYHTHAPITTPGGHPIPAIQALLPKAAGKLVAKLIPQVGDPSEAKAAIELTLAQKADFIKVVCDSFAPGYPEMSDAVLQALVREAHARKQRVFVHIASARNARSAVAAGADILAHGPYRSTLTPEDARAIAQGGKPMIYTLAATHGVAHMMRGDFQPDALDHRYNGSCILEPVTGEQGRQFAQQPVLGGFGGWVLAHADAQEANVRLLHAHGQRFIIGTDSPIPGAYAGAAVHQEMAQLHAAGVPKGEVLLGATAWAAEALWEDPDYGYVEVGKSADLVLLNGNPMKDLANTSEIRYVVRAGRVFELPARP